MATLQYGTLIQRVLKVVSAAGTTTLVNNSERNVEITGSTTQIVKLPDATTSKVGREFYIANRSTGSVTVNYNDNSLAVTIDPNTERLLYLTSVSTSNGTWDISTGSGGSGSGGGAPNLIVDGLTKNDSDFEGGTTGDWAGFVDPAQTTPTDGTGGGTPTNISFTASGTTPLEGNFSALWAKTGGANDQGNGYSLSSIPLPYYLRGQNLSCGFWFTIASGTYTQGDIQIWMYDQTNSALIIGDVQVLPGAPIGTPLKFVVNIPTATNTANLRFIIFQSSTTTNNYSIEFDKFFVSPVEVIQGAAVSDEVSYSPTITTSAIAPTFGTLTVNVATWARVGDKMHIHWDLHQTTAGTAGTGGVYLISLPSGYQIDSSKNGATGGGNLNEAVGSANIDAMPAVVSVFDSTHIFVDLPSGSWATSNHPFSQTDLQVGIDAWVPIVGWTSGVALSNSRVEYGSNSGMGDNDDTTSFINDPNGNQIPNVTYSAARLKRVRFKSQISPSDTLVLQIQGASGAWINLSGDMHDSTSTSLIKSYNGDDGYGTAVFTQVNKTDVDVIFARYQEPPTSNWDPANTSRWRVVKYSNAIPVESGIKSFSVSGSNGSFATTSSSYVDVTFLTVTITTTGRPVRLMLIPDGLGNPSYIDAQNTGTSPVITVYVNFCRNNVVIAENAFNWESTGSLPNTDVEWGISSHQHFDVVPAGTYTYKVQIKNSGVSGQPVQIQNGKLVAYEI